MSKSFKYHIALILLFICPYFLQAQVTNLYFDHINYDQNLSQSSISSIHQTKEGFIWIGTANGLVRYDGYNFLRYLRNREDKNSISNNHINVILEDNDKKLWIGTNHGLNLFNTNKTDFTSIGLSQKKGGSNYISSIIQDPENNIWVGTFGGVKKLDRENQKLLDISKNPNSPFKKSRVLSLFYDKKLGVLTGTSKGLTCFDPKTGAMRNLPFVWNADSSFTKAKIIKIVKESNGNLWFATETNGVFLYDAGKNQLINYLHNPKNKNTISSNWISDILLIGNKTIWFATRNGLCIFKKDKNAFISQKHSALASYSLSDNDVKCLLKDRHNSIWLGTVGGGLNFFHKSNSNFINIGETISPYFGLSNTLANALVKENDGSLWVGTYAGGLNYLDFKNNKSYSYLVDPNDSENSVNTITAMVNQNASTLLCGTFNGLFRFNKNSRTFTKIPLSLKVSKKPERPITSLILDNEDIWVGTNGSGLKKVNKTGIVENFSNDDATGAISDNFITDIKSEGDFLWIATQFGLDLFDKKKKQVVKVYKSGGPNSLSSNSLTILFSDSKKRLWIGTEYDGLNYLEPKTGKFYAINNALGFTDETIKSISEDAQGNLWVSANDLLFKIKIKKFEVPFKASNFEIISYSSKDGLKAKQFSNNCSLKLNNGNLVFGSSKGLTFFNPLNMIKNENSNEIMLTKLIINNKEVNPGDPDGPLDNSITETQKITLKYGQGYIGIEFSAMNFVNPENNEYAYKLESIFDKDDWHNIGSQHHINLTDLYSGTYDLKIKTSNEDGVWNPSIKTFRITILPPWWRTWWAYLFYTSLIITSLVLFFRFMRNREALKRTIFLEQAEKERQQELYKMKLDFFTNVSHEIRTPLTLISGPVEELLRSSEEGSNLESKLKIIKNNSDRLLKLVNELMDFRKAEKGSMKIYCEQQDIVPFCFEIYESFRGIAVEKMIDYRFVLNINSIPVYFDKNQMEKVIYNLLSNAFKFTNKNGRITVAVEQKGPDSDTIEIKVKDNGLGIPENRKKKIFKNFFQLDDRGSSNLGSGIGLALSKSIVELHRGEITVQTEKDATFSTIFIITLKKGKDHLKKSQIVESENIETEFVNPISDVKTEIVSHTAEIINDENEDNKKTLLIIDDNEDILSFVYDVLREDYRVLKFLKATDALEFMEKEIPDLIITDVMMPEMDGFELCKILKTNQNTNHIPVILLTAKSSTLNRIEGLSTGADSYISKPFSIEVLKLNIINLLSAKEIMRQKYSEKFIGNTEIENLETPEGIFLKKLTQIINDNIDNSNFDVNDLVKEIGMSRTVLYKKVQTLTNQSVAGFIKNMRLKRAAYLLINSNYPVSEVSYMVGFNDRKHFSKEFKKLYKYAPTAYKSSQTETE
ncbi:two component regulator with propeller domain [Flavobacterium sp. 270]|uniref:hybrid sensor histidine kinase/response regulator transcription factor n=1 Tax=Flavobacterium sp. 270 TaxID=2512114 RepID=UPI00106669BF|nr:two-component regulator propeller domain-containing protein [Flavobacterium sp. 270]TDW44579.1 two component regulator with propeller domain [Flavobacterium sp. 270]